VTEQKLSAEVSAGPPTDLIEVGVYQTAQEGFDHGLVVLTLGYGFWLEPADSGFRLRVESHVSQQVLHELAEFDRESVDWPPPLYVDPAPDRKVDLFTPMLWCMVVLISFWAQGRWGHWTGVGVLDTQAVFERGEWWRALSALFLHADIGHLVSNLVSGLFVFCAVVSTMGVKRGWLLLAAAAVAGNVAAAAAKYPAAYRSLGASTAIFAAVGLLTGRALRIVVDVKHPRRWKALFVPFAAGVTVLALFGAGGQQVDVLAHVTGFGAGLVLGFAIGARPPRQA
jgi:membrane associated rhomboid family serine protease